MSIAYLDLDSGMRLGFAQNRLRMVVAASRGSHPSTQHMNTSAMPAHRGFEGTILGAALPDLIQMECLAMSTRAVRVEQGTRMGRIFFAGGQIVHA
ncbi:MAG TPA: DUF4388 domain-containing protein, partial [Chthoniobacteraceae bacterium]|nr:DUF4388 domain-containing protein [Chthoniobacteraceae bacterium]